MCNVNQLYEVPPGLQRVRCRHVPKATGLIEGDKSSILRIYFRFLLGMIFFILVDYVFDVVCELVESLFRHLMQLFSALSGWNRLVFSFE